MMIDEEIEIPTIQKYYGYKYKLKDIVKDARRNSRRDWEEEQEFKRWLKYENKKAKREIEDEEVALYIVLRVDEDVSSYLTFGQYMDYVAQAMAFGSKTFDTNLLWEKTGYNRIILAADNNKRITELVTFAVNKSIPYKVLFRKGYGKRNRLSKKRAIVGIVLGPYYRDLISRATDHLPLF